MIRRALKLILPSLLLLSTSLATHAGDKKGDPVPTQPSKEAITNVPDSVVEKAFGPGSPEMKLPLRLQVPECGLVAAFSEFKINDDGHVVLVAPLGIAVMQRIASNPNAMDLNVFRGDKATIVLTRRANHLNDVTGEAMKSIEVQNKQSSVSLAIFLEDQPKDGFRPQRSSTTPFAPPKDGKDGPAREIVRPFETRFRFNFDKKTPLSELLPPAPKVRSLVPAPLNEDLAKVPELMFADPMSKKMTKVEALQKTAHVLAKANHLNMPKTDGFMLALIEKRGDLQGLPFLMGDECRTREDQARVFAEIADAINRTVREAKVKQTAGGAGGEGDVVDQMWVELIGELSMINVTNPKEGKMRISRLNREQLNRASVAALMQILMPESESFRLGLARCLATIQHIDATKALAKLVLFSPEEEVRAAAIEGLKLRRDKDYTDVLLNGFRYPLPTVSRRAAEALVKLERKDLLVNLIEVLERPDPRMPVTEKRDGKDVTFVRELVKVNHHRNCVLCHAPGNTDNTPEGVLRVAVPLPNEPFPKPSEGGGYLSTPPPTPDIVVRLDMTYLRQDFSLMMPVADAHPWPEMQRFDFLVRTRTLTASEAQAYEDCCLPDEPGRLSPYHRAALFALRELTGRDAEPTAAAWRKLLKLPRQ